MIEDLSFLFTQSVCNDLKNEYLASLSAFHVWNCNKLTIVQCLANNEKSCRNSLFRSLVGRLEYILRNIPQFLLYKSLISTNFRHASHLRYYVRYSSEFHYNNVVTLYISTILELLNSLNNLFYFISNICRLNFWTECFSIHMNIFIIEYLKYIFMFIFTFSLIFYLKKNTDHANISIRNIIQLEQKTGAPSKMSGTTFHFLSRHKQRQILNKRVK